MGPYGVPGSLSMGPYGVPGSGDSWTRGLGSRDSGTRDLGPWDSGTRDRGSRDLGTRAQGWPGNPGQTTIVHNSIDMKERIALAQFALITRSSL